MVLAHLGEERTEAELSEIMGAEWYGVPASRVVRLKKWGYRVSYEQASLEQLHRDLAAGIPCIIFLRTGALPGWELDLSHAVVLVGITAEGAHIHDPDHDSGPTLVDINAFLSAWAEMDYYYATIQRK